VGSGTQKGRDRGTIMRQGAPFPHSVIQASWAIALTSRKALLLLNTRYSEVTTLISVDTGA
jgi:hypothetical protein